MRTICAIALLFGLANVALSAITPQYIFDLTLRLDDSSPVALYLSVPPGTKHVLQATEYLKFEIEVPTSNAETSTTIVKLIDFSSGLPVVLHTSQHSGSIGEVRAFGYTVCGVKAFFQSPPQEKQQKCVK